ncbi:MAG TPA: ATP-dependent RecD-like DNA helicase [Candidatus Acidoferrales bacterium]|nr:ATP-dependent RecD-like DNA helicase [Candidatus Acidoferrales bacterium]
MNEGPNERSTLQGTLGRITYQHPETHYTVARLDSDGPASVTVVGALFPVSEGEEIKVFGRWKSHPRYGLQFQIDHWEKVEPVTLEGIEKYLGSGLIKGVGPSYAKRLVSAFGLDTLRVLSEEPLRILDVDGIGEVRARRIMQAWQEQRGMQDVMVFLQGHGVGAALSLRIFRALGPETISLVKDNPYILAQEIHGIGFLLADRIAANIGIRGDFPLRIQAGVSHVLRESADHGHCFVALAALLKNACGLLNVAEETTRIAIEKLVSSHQVIWRSGGGETGDRIYLAELYDAEQRVATAIERLLSTPSFLEGKRIASPENKRRIVDRGAIDVLNVDLLDALPIRLDEEQIQAAREALQQKVFVITGGPGTGKTTLLISLLAILRRAKVSFALAAPTGRAAKRMTESTGEEAMTLHRLLEFNPREGAFQRHEDNPLQVDVVIVDEASMVDLMLMDHLLRAIDPHSHLILVGDVDQLPSVGPGSVLKDLIESHVVPVTVLRRIFRQERQSLIVVNAHRILQGQQPAFSDARENRDFDFMARESEEEILLAIKDLLRERIPQSLHLPADQVVQAVQVLTPMHRGMLGTIQLNRELQNLFNPTGEALEKSGSLLRVRDKVMQLRNDYEKGVFNGDLGRIARIDREEGKICVDFDEKRVEYEADELDEICLAYATSIHKSQGSEYPAVVIPLHTSHYMMLYRSILYTAVTRGKQLVIVVGSRKALGMAIRNVRVERRNTGLREELQALLRNG